MLNGVEQSLTHAEQNPTNKRKGNNIEGDVDLKGAENNSTARKGKFDPLKVDLPFNTSFAAAWKDWVTHLNEKKKPLTQTSAERQLKRLASKPSEAIAMAEIDYAIEKGWQGLYDLPKDHAVASVSIPPAQRNYLNDQIKSKPYEPHAVV